MTHPRDTGRQSTIKELLSQAQEVLDVLDDRLRDLEFENKRLRMAVQNLSDEKAELEERHG